jgi:hypothetical protein
MAKQAILDINQGIYLVKLSAGHRKKLINQNLDAYELNTRLIDLSYRMRVGVVGYCVTERSLAILFQAPSSPNAFIQDLINHYTSWFNRVHLKRGPLFAADFQSILIEPGQYLLDAFHYVHTLPIIEELTSDAENYALSSYQEYTRNLQWSWLSTDIIKPLIGRHDTMFNRRLKEFLKQPAQYEVSKLVTGNQSDVLAYCSDHYLNTLHQIPEAIPNGIDIEQVTEFVCSLYQFKPVHLTTMKRHRLMPELKGMIAYLCEEYEIADQQQVMAELNLDEFDYQRNLGLMTRLCDTDMYDRRHAFERLLFKLSARHPISNPHGDKREQVTETLEPGDYTPVINNTAAPETDLIPTTSGQTS